MTRNNQLLLLTDFYPFEFREPFIKNEIPYLVAAFKHVHVLCSHADNKIPLYALAANETASYINSNLTEGEKLLSFRWFFTKIFWQEFFFIRNNYQLPCDIKIIKTMLLTLQTAVKYKRQLQKYIIAKKLTADPLAIYSYWTDARAIAAIWLKNSTPSVSISRAHGWDVYFERQTPPYLPFRKFIHDNIDAVFFVSDNGQDYSLEKVKGSKEKFKISRLVLSIKEEIRIKKVKKC